MFSFDFERNSLKSLTHSMDTQDSEVITCACQHGLLSWITRANTVSLLQDCTHHEVSALNMVNSIIKLSCTMSDRACNTDMNIFVMLSSWNRCELTISSMPVRMAGHRVECNTIMPIPIKALVGPDSSHLQFASGTILSHLDLSDLSGQHRRR